MTTKDQGQLLDGYLHGSLSEHEMAQLKDLLLANPEAVSQLANLSLVECMLIQLGRQEDLIADKRLAGILAVETHHLPWPQDQSKVDIAQIRQRAERQLEAFLEQQRTERLAQQLQGSGWDFPEAIGGIVGAIGLVYRTAVRMAKAVVVCSLAAIVVLVIHLYARAHRPVATLIDSRDAKWDSPIDKGEELRRGRHRLEEGYARIVFKKGAEVVLQAPSTLDLATSNRMFLETGWMAAKVPQEARGFTVETPQSSVVDFGTEFGLFVGAGNNSEVHVFDGEIALESGGKKGSGGQREVLREGAAVVEASGRVERSDVNDRPRLFVRTMPDAGGLGIPGKRVDLADVVGGGSGFGTGRVAQGGFDATGTINQITGKPNDPTRPTAPAAGREYDSVHHECSNQYVRAHGLAYVDGVFVPDGGKGPTVVSSAGHVFRDCPDTDGRIKWNILNGWRYRDLKDPKRNNDRLTQTHGISMHANVGITFDLAAVRRALPGVEVRSFSTRAGAPITYSPDVTKIDIWVLVDGEVRFAQRDVRVPQMFDIRVALRSQDRFLTLVVTDSAAPGPAQESSGVDWSFWEEPVLELESIPISDDKPIKP